MLRFPLLFTSKLAIRKLGINALSNFCKVIVSTIQLYRSDIPKQFPIVLVGNKFNIYFGLVSHEEITKLQAKHAPHSQRKIKTILQQC